ncbi:hypothetical protein J7T55_011924 [Diaporthe amygdali]|uniref:uncharacterized protein n=1 Tax=Phomopsis amygdali TaxID=1214568 RepID=UPI0022FE36CE|nr:uncharacterized protein J7T55_011924 [Diaporthe amygdali]KAJ0123459.1 hypothetical protein J7T55_011924 [Diaporthe amygdali]
MQNPSAVNLDGQYGPLFKKRLASRIDGSDDYRYDLSWVTERGEPQTLLRSPHEAGDLITQASVTRA